VHVLFQIKTENKNDKKTIDHLKDWDHWVLWIFASISKDGTSGRPNTDAAISLLTLTTSLTSPRAQNACKSLT